MVSKGAETTILGAEGNAEHIDQEKLSLLPGVERGHAGHGAPIRRPTGSTTRRTR